MPMPTCAAFATGLPRRLLHGSTGGELAASVRMTLLLVLLVLTASTRGRVNAFNAPFGVPFPSAVTLRTAVLTNTVPLAFYDADASSGSPTVAAAATAAKPFPRYQGFQPDLLRHLIQIAQSLDNVTLTLELEEAPPFSYKYQYEYMAVDCNVSVYHDIEIPLEECHRLDFITGDFYGYPSRSIRAMLTPPLLTTAAATIQYVHRQERQITTLAEAQALQEPVCLLDDSHYDVQTLERFPDLKVLRCYNDHLECIQWLKAEKCALFVEDELQLRYIMVQDAELQVTPEHFDEQYIVWPVNSRLDPLLQQLLIRWIYQAKVSGVLDQLYDQYFRVAYCPLGKAGANCDMPCSAAYGSSDRFGKCVCESTQWTGEDCSEQVLEDKNLIPSSLIIVCYVMIAINFLGVAICAGWLFWSRKTPQVNVAQPLFLSLVLVGCLISTSTIFALAQEDDGEVGRIEFPPCQAIPWLYSIGFSITFGSLFAKIRRVYHIFSAAATMQRVSMSAKDTIIIVGIVFSIDVAILTVWTIADPLEWDRQVLTTDKYGNPLSSQGYCTCDTWVIFASIIAAYHFTLMGIACWMCYRARDIPTEFSEGKYLAIAMISNMQIFVVGVPVLIILGTDSQTSFFVRSVIIWMNDFVVLGLIFGNLMWSVHIESDNNKMLVRDAMQTFTQRREKRASMASRGSIATSGNFVPTPSMLNSSASDLRMNHPVGVSSMCPSSEDTDRAFTTPSTLGILVESTEKSRADDVIETKDAPLEHHSVSNRCEKSTEDTSNDGEGVDSLSDTGSPIPVGSTGRPDSSSNSRGITPIDSADD